MSDFGAPQVPLFGPEDGYRRAVPGPADPTHAADAQAWAQAIAALAAHEDAACGFVAPDGAWSALRGVVPATPAGRARAVRVPLTEGRELWWCAGPEPSGQLEHQLHVLSALLAETGVPDPPGRLAAEIADLTGGTLRFTTDDPDTPPATATEQAAIPVGAPAWGWITLAADAPTPLREHAERVAHLLDLARRRGAALPEPAREDVATLAARIDAAGDRAACCIGVVSTHDDGVEAATTRLIERMRERLRSGDAILRSTTGAVCWVMRDGGMYEARRALDRMAAWCAHAWGDPDGVHWGVSIRGHGEPPSACIARAERACAEAHRTAARAVFTEPPSMTATWDMCVGMADAVDAIDPVGHRHSIAVATVAVTLARRLCFAPTDQERLWRAARVHDIGKVTIPRALLRSTHALTPDERACVEGHVQAGVELSAHALDEEQRTWVAHHHEHYDGGGYPRGLRAEDISLGGRVLALADSWDVMTSARGYTAARDALAALAEARRMRARQFDPRCVDALEAALFEGDLSPVSGGGEAHGPAD